MSQILVVMFGVAFPFVVGYVRSLVKNHETEEDYFSETADWNRG